MLARSWSSCATQECSPLLVSVHCACSCVSLHELIFFGKNPVLVVKSDHRMSTLIQVATKKHGNNTVETCEFQIQNAVSILGASAVSKIKKICGQVVLATWSIFDFEDSGSQEMRVVGPGMVRGCPLNGVSTTKFPTFAAAGFFIAGASSIS